MTLIPRGEFSIVIAGLGAAIEPQLAPVATGYVLVLAILGPILMRHSDLLLRVTGGARSEAPAAVRP